MSVSALRQFGHKQWAGWVETGIWGSWAHQQSFANVQVIALPQRGQQVSIWTSPSLIQFGDVRRLSLLVTGCDRRHRTVQPSSEQSLLYQLENCVPTFENRFQPCEAAHLREINSPETEASNKYVDAITEGLVAKRIHRLGDCRRAVGLGPAVFHLGVSLRNRHFQWRVRHRKR